jgi:hypothetical protein
MNTDDERWWRTKRRIADPFGNSASDFLVNDTASLLDSSAYGFETAAFAEFHGDFDLTGAGRQVGTIEADDILMNNRQHVLELAWKLLYVGVSAGDGLPGHDLAVVLVPDLVDSAVSALAETGDHLEIVVAVAEKATRIRAPGRKRMIWWSLRSLRQVQGEGGKGERADVDRELCPVLCHSGGRTKEVLRAKRLYRSRRLGMMQACTDLS